MSRVDGGCAAVCLVPEERYRNYCGLKVLRPLWSSKSFRNNIGGVGDVLIVRGAGAAARLWECGCGSVWERFYRGRLKEVSEEWGQCAVASFSVVS